MIVKWLRENTIAAGILTFIRLYVGWEFLHAGWGKLTGPEPFSALGFLKGAAAQAAGEHPAVQAWWAGFLNGFAIPNHGLFDFIVPWGEFLVGLGLILGCLTTVAVFFGMTMNFAFLLSGTTSTNPQLVLLSIFIIIAGANAGKFGLDRWVIPFIKKTALKQEEPLKQNA
jgi:thiosulfate dehydrogenase (quinone) large subunit